MPLSLSPSLLMSSASSVAFSPLSLFASGEQGAWYDPSDLTTMFQDTAGTTPVTATGQTVGLLLDKSKGLVLGPELVTNGWTTDAGWSQSGQTFTATNAAVNTGVRVAGLGVAGRWYRITITWSGANGAWRFYGDRFATLGDFSTASGTINAYWLSTGGTTELRGLTGSQSGTFNISVKELPGNHATQSTAASRPQYQVDGNGKAYLLFDGTDDFLLTGTITPGTDKAQVFAGVRKLSDAAAGVLVESSASSGSNLGTFAALAPKTSGQAGYSFRSQGGSFAQTDATSTAFASPVTTVLAGLGDIAADGNVLRANGAQVASSAQDQGTGNYLAYPLYIGRRGGTTLPYNGRIYGLAVRFGANLSAAQISQMETWLNARTGAF